ncbi:DNA-binding family protein [Raphanus sativus]|nr:DNA-binding family protein [Raphanus sativus]
MLKSQANGQIFGGGVGGLLKAPGPAQVILGTFQLERKKDGRNGVKGDDELRIGNMLPSPSGTESLHGYHPVLEHSNGEHHSMTSGGAHLMLCSCNHFRACT